MKKRGFGMGKWNGFGGKCEPGESFKQCAIREAKEEISIEPKKLKSVATLRFYGSDPEANWETEVFLISSWDGLPDESDEVRPEWFSINDIPYENMWQDDTYWLPKVLAGEKIIGEFVFDKENNLVEHIITPV